MPAPNISQILTTTMEGRSGELADNITRSHALLMKLESRGKAKPANGGVRIRQELEYAENGTFKWYSGYDPIDISPSEVFTAAEFDWKQCAVSVSINGLEEIQNSGENAFIPLMASKIANGMKTFKNRMGDSVYGDGSMDGGKAIGGLPLLVSDNPTLGTVGGINAAIWDFWRNRAFDCTADFGAPMSPANVQGYMNRLYLQLTRNNERPDLILCDNNYYQHYWDSLLAHQRFTNDELGQAGFTSIRYQKAEVIYDGGIGGGCPTNHMYMLNTDYLHLRHHPDRKYRVLGGGNSNGERINANQDALIKIWVWAGNMTISNRFMHGVLKD